MERREMEDGSNSGGLAAGSGDATIVVGPLYCAPHLVDLTFTTEAPGVKSGHLAVVDANGNVMYKLERRHLNMRHRKLILDPSDRPILLVQSEHKTSHAVYDVFRGDNRDAKDLLFKIKKVSEAEVQVFLAANIRQYPCDFTVRGNINVRAVTVFRGNSTDIAAEMSKECKLTSEVNDESAFGVAVRPNVDSCFIAALFAALPDVSSAKLDGAHRAETYGDGDGSVIAAAAIEGVAEGVAGGVAGKLLTTMSDLVGSLVDEN